MDTTNFQYELDDSLQTIYTRRPIPVLEIREVLQLIANAGKCVLDVDRNGVIKIYRPETLVQLTDVNDVELIDNEEVNIFGINRLNETDFKFDFTNMFTVPRVDKYPPLRNLTTSFITHNVEATVSELGNYDLSAVEETEFYLEYDMATDVTSVLSGTLAIVGTPEYYAKGCVITLTGSGTVTLNGKRIVESVNRISKNFNPNGDDCVMENEFINNEVDALEYVNWAGEILQKSNVYSFENRGFPELCPIDTVFFDTLYTNNIQPSISENKITYDGALRASTKVLI